jgi:deoxyribodipyrimidine photo-lyase
MDKNTPISIFWFRRDLRVEDNAGLYHALKSGKPVLPVFIFDKEILGKLEDKDDARVTFIYNAIEAINKECHKHHSSLLVFYDDPEHAWEKLVKEYPVAAVYTNHDYEPGYAQHRDSKIKELLAKHNITFNTYKDQVIFEKAEVVKDDGKPYTVFTPYKNKWYQKLKPFYLKAYPSAKYLKNLHKFKAPVPPTLKEMGFTKSEIYLPEKEYHSVIADYAKIAISRHVRGTSHIGVHLRFGTVSIRQLAQGMHTTPRKNLAERVDMAGVLYDDTPPFPANDGSCL